MFTVHSPHAGTAGVWQAATIRAETVVRADIRLDKEGSRQTRRCVDHVCTAHGSSIDSSECIVDERRHSCPFSSTVKPLNASSAASHVGAPISVKVNAYST